MSNSIFCWYCRHTKDKTNFIPFAGKYIIGLLNEFELFGRFRKYSNTCALCRIKLTSAFIGAYILPGVFLVHLIFSEYTVYKYILLFESLILTYFLIRTLVN